MDKDELSTEELPSHYEVRRPAIRHPPKVERTAWAIPRSSKSRSLSDNDEQEIAFGASRLDLLTFTLRLFRLMLFIERLDVA